MTDLARLWDTAWGLLEAALSDRAAPARLPVLATAGLEGGASARVVVLRGADRAARRLEIHADAASLKAAELARDPAATLLVWDPARQMQLRLQVRVGLLAGDPGRWQAVPELARAAYGGTPPPGTPLADPADWHADPVITRHLALICDLQALEILHLEAQPHRRALFRAETGWQGGWIAP
ncbi:PNPOx family protein [Mangrovicoccus algicola]|uniref:Pyridoxamine 5'-phosphate oxidase family protein n=1 Tax=Mangrovicoccus algicola TaxID=2771008 RepID=A0A8J7CX22_9RHOB|nr:pyridoxamine 5'-phosphate oxidase family protein [Mangrovicoccus algicola]MBE3638457.1 pyridoxamine 5'-phosphate oxidase family protein [Mangrovicoccus algicola]